MLILSGGMHAAVMSVPVSQVAELMESVGLTNVEVSSGDQLPPSPPSPLSVPAKRVTDALTTQTAPPFAGVPWWDHCSFLLSCRTR